RALQYRRQGGDPDAVRKQFRSAADHARRAIAGKPDHGPAHVLLGLAQKELGQKKEAQETLQRAIQCSPDLAEAHLYLGQMLAEAGQKDEARRRLEQAVRLSRPEDRRAQTALDQLNNSKDE
ncbi:MAG TPA: tetratricopeptide repeat protein, partial [Gemmataceae bacterium]|nr:tetratricopeptide repeat protein [Gemmataceae bacterium]